MKQITDLDAAQRVDDRGVYIGLHRASTVWPLLPGEKRIPKGCDQQGRHPEAAHAASEVTDADDDMSEGMGAIVVPAVVAATLSVAALVAFLAGWL